MFKALAIASGKRLPRSRLNARVSRAVLTGLGAMVLSQALLAAPVSKTFLTEGISTKCEGTICLTSTFRGKIHYLDPDDAAPNTLGLSAVTLFTFDAGFGVRQLQIPYFAPRDNVKPSLTISELGDSITVDLLAYSDFDPSPLSTDMGRRWRISGGTFDWDSGHGESIFSSQGGVRWNRVPEPGSLLLSALALLTMTGQSLWRARTR